MQGVGLIPSRGAKIAMSCGKKKKKKKTQSIKQKQYRNKFNKDFKNGSHQKNLKKTKKSGTTTYELCGFGQVM